MFYVLLKRYVPVGSVVLLAMLASSCGGSGGSVGASDPTTASFVVDVCGAEVPEPASGEQACSEALTIEYEVPQ
ncbi:MAG: hypothetical protein RI554_11485 [Trueperaceae bacterium]|nr:hypothetical protein [Trueperaceae bacterium]